MKHISNIMKNQNKINDILKTFQQIFIFGCQKISKKYQEIFIFGCWKIKIKWKNISDFLKKFKKSSLPDVKKLKLNEKAFVISKKYQEIFSFICWKIKIKWKHIRDL